ncbi:leucyl aminopeptidase [Desulfatiferula olefinivorans]
MIALSTRSPMTARTDLLVLLATESKYLYQQAELKALVKKAVSFPEFSGKAGEQLILTDPSGVKARRVLIRGLGAMGRIDSENIRRACGAAVRWAVQGRIETLSFVLPDLSTLKPSPAVFLEAMAEGACLANDLFDVYRETKTARVLQTMTVYTGAAMPPGAKDRIKRIQTICEAGRLARSWVSMPANDKPPLVLAGLIGEAFADSPVTVHIHDEDWLEQQGFGAMLAVARGSLNRSALVVMDHHPEKARRTVVLVGKGVTFDSGGLDLKTAEGMGTMKMDMAGAAAVAGALRALSSMCPDIRIVGVTPLVENMPSGQAFRPGDIVRSYSGKTIEIGNTDAEGRLILADALAWASRTYAPDLMVDLATLTGACMVALGDRIAGVFSPDRALALSIEAAGRRSGERCWPLPLVDDYKELLKSDFADIGNMAASKYGGAITAALFLSEFVGKARWAHVDIAGPAYASKATDLGPSGGTGFGVRLLCELIGSGGLLKAGS